VIPAKVAALITRRIDDRIEVCVFDHAGNVQLPAGTLEPGELPVEGAVREAWEETGIPRLELVGEIEAMWEFALDERQNVALMVAPHDGCPVTRGHGVLVLERTGSTVRISNEYFGWEGEVPAACVERDVSRHVFHLRATTPTPDEWWVLTPDGEGSQWRCRWVAIDDVAIHPWQQRWIDAGRGVIDAGPSVERADPLPAGATEMFWAPVAPGFDGSRAVVTPHEGQRPPADGVPASAGAVCVTADGDAVVVTEDPKYGWGCPGGRPEGDETPEETLAREVLEEACARVVESELLVTHELHELDDDRAVVGHRWSPGFWARVELDEWAPTFEKEHRRVVPLAQVNDLLRWEAPPFVRWLELATAVEARRH
jgi:8-oxo-dGTP pyrophosphatase MutT (NUDIX family)